MSKIILSFETSSSICGVSVMDNGNLLSLVEENSYRKHNENIADFTDRAIKQSKKLISEIVSEKIDMAFKEVKGLEDHEVEMNDIAKEAIDSYKQLMSLGMNVSDMAAGKVFAEASNMLKIALDASDSKTKAKLQQVDLMIKKARLDNNTGRSGDTTADGSIVYDRNELLKIMNKNDK